MSEDTFTEVTNASWLSRIGSAIKGIVIGLALFIVAFPILFWNEGRAVRRYKTLNEGAGSVISLPEARVLPENDGKLVHRFASGGAGAGGHIVYLVSHRTRCRAGILI